MKNRIPPSIQRTGLVMLILGQYLDDESKWLFFTIGLIIFVFALVMEK